MTSTQILAATFTIAFEGLMLFQGPSASEKTHVRLVDAPHHDPFVFIIGGKKEIKLDKGDRITFSIGQGVGYTDDAFNQNVITLKDHVVFGNVDQKVIVNSLDHAGTLATVDLPNGKLTTLFMFPDRVKLDTWLTFSSKHCFPRYVVLTTQTSSTVTMTITHKDRSSEDLPVHSGIVVVSNGGPQGSPDTHFHEYRRMLGTFAYLEKAVFPVDLPCPRFPPLSPLALDERVVEELRARINRIPNGDCGPVDNP